ncbi:MAG: carboxypeptidase-like regulatory domain-containing protein [Vicinamibacteria bacterium]
MTIKKFLGAFLSFAMAVPSNATTTQTGTVKGVVSMAGRGLEGLALTLVNVETGKSFSVRSDAAGAFSATLPPGSYVFSSPGRSGVSISRAPLSVDVVSGKVASADVEVAAMAFQGQTPVPTGTATITHDAADCITEGEFTLVEAIFEPLSSVVNGRLYFQSNLSPEWFYTEFEKIEPPVAGGPTHRAFIPKVNKDGGIETINYYIQVTSSDFAETKSPERTVRVVAGATDCKGKLAPIGTPDGAVSVLSASGAAAGSLAGFGGIAGVGLGVAAIVAIVAGVAVGGVVVKKATETKATPTPTAATPVPTVAPTATPTATPQATCSLTVAVSPDAPADPAVGGRFCTAFVTSSVGGNLGAVNGQKTFPGILCSARIEIVATAADQSSFQGPLPATWSGVCGGSALGSPCILNPLSNDRTVVLTCQTR